MAYLPTRDARDCVPCFGGENIITRYLPLIFLLLQCCSKDTIVPPELERTPREYTWVRDTLGDGTYQSTMTGLWGSSSHDVYIVGHASNFGDKKMWHYNGQAWEDITFRYFQAFGGQPIYGFTPVGVFGFGPNDVWIVGKRDTSATSNELKRGFTLRYDGQTWTGMWLPAAYAHLAIWGTASNDIWVGGYAGQLVHFNGSSWQEYFLPDSVFVNHIDGLGITKVYAEGLSLANSILRTTYYEWNGVSWSRIESQLDTAPPPLIGGVFTFTNGDMLTARNENVLRRISGGNWQIIFNNPQAHFGVIKAFGGSNVFAMGDDNNANELVYHYNGQNWSRITGINNPGGNVIRAWTDGKEAFLVAQELSNHGTVWPRTFVLRGK